jgi:hypothetical protein
VQKTGSSSVSNFCLIQKKLIIGTSVIEGTGAFNIAYGRWLATDVIYDFILEFLIIKNTY